VVSYFLRYFSSTSTEQISPDSAGPFTSFDPVGFAIFAKHLVALTSSARASSYDRVSRFAAEVSVRNILRRVSRLHRRTMVARRPIIEGTSVFGAIRR
jgi:hypothetical protein